MKYLQWVKLYHLQSVPLEICNIQTTHFPGYKIYVWVAWLDLTCNEYFIFRQYFAFVCLYTCVCVIFFSLFVDPVFFSFSFMQLFRTSCNHIHCRMTLDSYTEPRNYAVHTFGLMFQHYWWAKLLTIFFWKVIYYRIKVMIQCSRKYSKTKLLFRISWISFSKKDLIFSLLSQRIEMHRNVSCSSLLGAFYWRIGFHLKVSRLTHVKRAVNSITSA